MNITEIQSAANEGNIDKIYELIEGPSPCDSEREQLQEIALQHVVASPEVAVAVTLGTSEEFGRQIYKTLLINNQAAAVMAMSDGEIPGYDIPVEDVLLLIAEHCSTEIWDWTIKKYTDMNDCLEEEGVVKLIGEAALVAAEKNPALFEKLKKSKWEWVIEESSEEQRGGVGVIAAIYSTAASFKKIMDFYQPYLDDCAVAAAENGRIDNLEVLLSKGYDITSYPLDPDNGTLADIADLKNQTATVEWLISKGVKRDF
jgi:hypothetical protein